MVRPAPDLGPLRLPAVQETNDNPSAIVRRRAPGRIEVPSGTLDVWSFCSGASLEESVRIPRRHEVDHVLLYANPSPRKQPGRLPGITP